MLFLSCMKVKFLPQNSTTFKCMTRSTGSIVKPGLSHGGRNLGSHLLFTNGPTFRCAAYLA